MKNEKEEGDKKEVRNEAHLKRIHSVPLLRERGI